MRTSLAVVLSVSGSAILAFPSPAAAGHVRLAPRVPLAGRGSPAPTLGRAALPAAPAAPRSRTAGEIATRKKHRPRVKLSITPSTLASQGGNIVVAYTARYASKCYLGVSPDFWDGSNPVRVDCMGKYRPFVDSLTAGVKFVFTFIAKGKGGVARISRSFSQQAPPGLQIDNWSG